MLLVLLATLSNARVNVGTVQAGGTTYGGQITGMTTLAAQAGTPFAKSAQFTKPLDEKMKATPDVLTSTYSTHVPDQLMSRTGATNRYPDATHSHSIHPFTH